MPAASAACYVQRVTTPFLPRLSMTRRSFLAFAGAPPIASVLAQGRKPAVGLELFSVRAGASPWREIFEAAEAAGGVEFYLLEQEGSRYPELETAERCLATYRQMRG